MIEGSVQIAGHEILVQDEQVMIFVPGAEGGSEPIDFDTITRLSCLTGLASAHYEQMRRKEETGYPYPSLQEGDVSPLDANQTLTEHGAKLMNTLRGDDDGLE